MKMRVKELAHLPNPPHVVVQSFEGSIYRMVARCDGQEFLLTDDEGNYLTERHPHALTELLHDIMIDSVSLEHHSAYDEMIGNDRDANGKIGAPNTLVIDITAETLLKPSRH